MMIRIIIISYYMNMMIKRIVIVIILIDGPNPSKCLSGLDKLDFVLG